MDRDPNRYYRLGLVIPETVLEYIKYNKVTSDHLMELLEKAKKELVEGFQVQWEQEFDKGMERTAQAEETMTNAVNVAIRMLECIDPAHVKSVNGAKQCIFCTHYTCSCSYVLQRLGI